MAWTISPRWAHGDTNVSAARMNILSDNEAFLFGALQGMHTALKPMGTGEEAQFVNVWRWLHYQTRAGEQGSIKDPSNINPDVQLNSSESAMAVYDLANVDWLTQGQAYRATGLSFAAEDFEA